METSSGRSSTRENFCLFNRVDGRSTFVKKYRDNVMREVLSKCDPISRRRFVEYFAKSMLGVSLLPTFERIASAQETVGGKAKRMIYLFMSGGVSHLDTFDL